ncbi:MAG: FAD-dependent oxidoreductase, partial [Dehalococcoidia bacterium]
MEVARVAALRGHQVSLFEAESTLGGGQLALAQAAPFKEKLGWFKEYLTRELERLPVDVRLRSPVDAATVEREAPEVLVVATGAVPLVPDIPGIGGENVVTAHHLLRGEAVPQGKRVVVLGGRQVGCETAEYLALRDNSVTIVARSPADQLADDAPNTYRNALLKRLGNGGVELIVEHDVREVLKDGLTLVGPGGTERFLPADLVVIARGVVAQRSLADEMGSRVDEVHVIGDSQEPRTIAEAMYEGTLLGRQI